MTIAVQIRHSDLGHPAPVYIQAETLDGTPVGPPAVLKDTDAPITIYVHSGKRIVITETPPGAI